GLVLLFGCGVQFTPCARASRGWRSSTTIPVHQLTSSRVSRYGGGTTPGGHHEETPRLDLPQPPQRPRRHHPHHPRGRNPPHLHRHRPRMDRRQPPRRRRPHHRERHHRHQEIRDL